LPGYDYNNRPVANKIQGHGMQIEKILADAAYSSGGKLSIPGTTKHHSLYTLIGRGIKCSEGLSMMKQMTGISAGIINY